MESCMPIFCLTVLLLHSPASGDDLRLVNGSSPCAGRVEILHEGQWGTVCSGGWDIEDAGVVCKQLGCGSAVSAPGLAHFGEGSGTIWLALVSCSGSHSALRDCRSWGWGVTSFCTHALDAGVICSEPAELRLAGSSSPCSGQVEVRFEGSWGTVCGDSWDLKDAQVVCRQLGCGAAESTGGGGEATFGQGNGTIWLDEVYCRGSEMHPWDCRHSPLRHNECYHKEDAWVTCAGVPTISSPLKTEASPSRLQPQRDMTIPVIACIVLGALLFVVLVLLAGQLQHNRMLRRGREQIPLKRRELRKVTHSGPSALF